jgi:hypothetical protein
VEGNDGSFKYEDIYLRGYEAVPELQHGLGQYFPYYNEERLHQALEYRTPAAVYRQGRAGGKKNAQEQGRGSATWESGVLQDCS